MASEKYYIFCNLVVFCFGVNAAVSTGIVEAAIDRGFPKSMVLLLAMIASPMRSFDGKRAVGIFLIRAGLVMSEFIPDKVFNDVLSNISPKVVGTSIYVIGAVALVVATVMELRYSKAGNQATPQSTDMKSASEADKVAADAVDTNLEQKESQPDITATVMQTGQDDKGTQTPKKIKESRLLMPKKVNMMDSPSRMMNRLKDFNSPGRRDLTRSPTKAKGTQELHDVSRKLYRTRSQACVVEQVFDEHRNDLIKVD